MNHRITTPRSSQAGFTLIELLVVIAIIAILAALLFPTLAKGKASAKSAACKSNLRELGFALTMYVGDYHKYPGNAAMYSGGTFQGIWGTGMNWLNAYVPGKWGDASFRYFAEPHSPTVFNCPAVEPRQLPGFFGSPGVTTYPLGYGYNELGTGWKDGSLRLGLGFSVEITGFDELGQPLGPRGYIVQSDIEVSSDMIAIGDGGNWLSPNHPDGILDFDYGTVSAPHRGSANMVFADGHVESAKRMDLVGESEPARRRWNNDHQPHPETW